MCIFVTMGKRKIPLEFNCGLDLIAQVLYGKWKIRLLYFIHQGFKRPGELHRKIPSSSRRVIFMQLKELEEHELISKIIYPVLPPKVEYSLTELGASLIPVIQAIGDWADEHENTLKRVIYASWEPEETIN
jgi:DNA-binding HxlR family transcriptional regulator